MAKKNNDEQAIPEPAVEANVTPEERHQQLRSARRALEAELGEIDGKLRDAIAGGDLDALNSLTARRAELPALFVAASTAETTARRELFNAEDRANVARLQAAEAARDELQTAFDRQQLRHEQERATLLSELQEAKERVGAISSEIAGSRNLGASGDAGFKKSLSALAGV